MSEYISFGSLVFPFYEDITQGLVEEEPGLLRYYPLLCHQGEGPNGKAPPVCTLGHTVRSLSEELSQSSEEDSPRQRGSSRDCLEPMGSRETSLDVLVSASTPGPSSRALNPEEPTAAPLKPRRRRRRRGKGMRRENQPLREGQQAHGGSRGPFLPYPCAGYFPFEPPSCYQTAQLRPSVQLDGTGYHQVIYLLPHEHLDSAFLSNSFADGGHNSALGPSYVDVAQGHYHHVRDDTQTPGRRNKPRSQCRLCGAKHSMRRCPDRCSEKRCTGRPAHTHNSCFYRPRECQRCGGRGHGPARCPALLG